MLYESSLILSICTDGDLSDPAYRQNVLLRVFPNEDDRFCRGPTFFAMLDNMPPPKKQARIIGTLTDMTTTAGFEIDRFRWWDIVPGQRNLTATIRRDGHEIPVQFFWRAPRADVSALTAPRSSWIPRPHESAADRAFRFCLDIEASHYDLVLSIYARWLAEPLVFPSNRSPVTAAA